MAIAYDPTKSRMENINAIGMPTLEKATADVNKLIGENKANDPTHLLKIQMAKASESMMIAAFGGLFKADKDDGQGTANKL